MSYFSSFFKFTFLFSLCYLLSFQISSTAIAQGTQTGNCLGPCVITSSNSQTSGSFSAAVKQYQAFNPTSASSFIAIGALFQSDWLGTVSNTANSHNPSLIGYNTNSISSASSTNKLGIGVEGKCENLVANARYTTCLGVDSQALNSGAGSTMDNFTGFQMDVPTNNGTFTKIIGLHLLDYSALGGTVTQKFGIQQDDPNMASYFRSPVYGPLGYINNLGGSNSVGELSPPISFGYATGRFYYGNVMSGTFTASPLSANTFYCSPFSIAKRQTFTKVGLRVITGQVATNAHIGFYYVNNGIATSIVNNGGNFDATVSLASSNADAEATVAWTFESGEYCAALVTNATTATVNAYNDYFAPFVVGMTTSTGNETFITAGQAFGSLPTTAPAFTYSNPVANQFLFIAIYLRP